MRPWLHVDTESAHLAACALCLSSVERAIFATLDCAIDIRHRYMQIKCELEQVLPHKRGKGAAADGGFAKIVAAVFDKPEFALAALGGH